MCDHHDNTTIGEKSPTGVQAPKLRVDTATAFLRKVQRVCKSGDVCVFGGFPLMRFGGGVTADLDVSVPTEMWSVVCDTLIEFAGAVRKTPKYDQYSRMFRGRSVRIATLTIPSRMGGFDVDILDSKPSGGLDFRVNGIVWNLKRNYVTTRQGIGLDAVWRDISCKTTTCVKRVNQLVGGNVVQRREVSTFLKRIVRMLEKGWKLRNVPYMCHASDCDDCSICGGLDSSSGRMASFHVKLQCGVEDDCHHFCVECLSKWMRETGPNNSKCPLCREDIQFEVCDLLTPSDLDIATTVPKGKSASVTTGAAAGAVCSGDGSGASE